MSATRIVTGKEIWAAPEPTDAMVWAICPYLLKNYPLAKCTNCPKWETIKGYGKCKRGCRMHAEEACRVVQAAKAKGRANQKGTAVK